MTASTFWSAHSTDFGQTWAREGDLPPGFLDAGDLSCLPGAACLVTGYTATTAGHGQGAIAISTDGGGTWAAAVVPAGTGLLQGAVCATISSCLAVGTTSTTVSAVVPAHGALLTSDDGGHTWVLSAATQPIDDIFGIACPSASICVMVGTNWVGTPAVGTGAVAHSSDGGADFDRVGDRVHAAGPHRPVLPDDAALCRGRRRHGGPDRAPAHQVPGLRRAAVRPCHGHDGVAEPTGGYPRFGSTRSLRSRR